MPAPRRNSLSTWLQAALIAAAAAGVGLGTLDHGLVFDDHLLIGGNSAVIRGEAPLLSPFTYRYWGAADEASPNELYRPITIVSLGLTARLAGPDPWSMHAGNLLLHAANALLAWVLIGRLFGRRALALLAALIFAVHPIATEAVAPIAGRADLLATLFLLTVSILSLAIARRRGVWIVGGGLAMALAVFMGALSKESAFTAPLVTIAVLGADARRHRGTAKETRDYRWTAATMIGIQVFVLAMVVVLRFGILGYVYRSDPPTTPSIAYLAFVNNPLQFAPPLGRVLTGLRVAVMGAGRLVLPAHLSADYSYNQIPVTAGGPGLADLGAVVFAALYLGLLLWSARRYPVVFFSLSWSALTYLIVSNLLFPIGTIFGERLLYTPSIGFALLVAAGLERIGGGNARRRLLAAALAAGLLGLYATRFTLRCEDWADDETLFTATLAASPLSAKAHSNRGFTHLRAGRPEDAIQAYSRALEIAPGLTGSGVSLARALMQVGRTEEAIRRYQDVIAYDDGISVAWSGLGLAQESADRMEEAEDSFRRALSLSMGGNHEALRGLARVMARTGREREAVDILERLRAAAQGQEETLRDLAQARYLLGIRLLGEQRLNEFLDSMRSVLELDPDHGPARYNLALHALERGRKEEARLHAEAGLRSGYRFPPGFLAACGLPEPAPSFR